jgi:hypothetical protein
MRFFIISLFLFSLPSMAQVNWQSKVIADGSNLQKLLIINDSIAVVAGLNNCLKRTTDSGVSWSDVILPDTVINHPDVDYMGAAMVGNRLLLSSTRYKISDNFYADPFLLSSTNKGHSWDTLSYRTLSDKSNNPEFDPYAAFAYGRDMLTVGMQSEKDIYVFLRWFDNQSGSQVNRSNVFYSDDTGATWSRVFDADLGGGVVNAIEFVDTVGYIAGNNIFRKWTPTLGWHDVLPVLYAAGDNNMYVSDLQIISKDTVLITTTVDGVLLTTDGMQTCTKIGYDGGQDAVRINPQTYFLFGTTSKTSYTNNGGISWEQASAGASLFESGGIWNGNVYALGADKIYYFSLEDLKVSVNETTTTDLRIAQRGYGHFVVNISAIARLDVYNIQGIKVYSAILNEGANDCDLSHLKSGIYIFNTVAKEGISSTAKVLLP